MSTHHMQRKRKQNLDLIAKWIKEAGDEEIDRNALIRKACLVIGCSRETAREYVKLIMGDWAGFYE